MIEAFSTASIRTAEAASGELESGALMDRAAAAVAHEATAELVARRGRAYGALVLVAVGPGNNGGDGLYAGARLAARGVAVRYWLTAGDASEGGLEAIRRAGARAVDAGEAIGLLPEADLVVDAVLGIGGRGGLPAGVATFAAACADLDVPVLAVDVPSGLVADSCAAGESFRAAATVTFGTRKPCHVLEPARSRCGRVAVADLGLSPERPALRAWELVDLVAHLPLPGPTSDKYARGVVGLDTGSATYIGAGILSATGAVYAGAGMVRFLGPKPGPVRLALPSIVVSPGRVQAWLFGSGWGGRDGSAEIQAALAEGVPLVLDADALVPDRLPQVLRPDVLLTPHAGELARLLGSERASVAADPLGAVADAVATFGATVLLKGATQYVAGPAFPVTVALPGPAWTAQAGSGDVLAGMAATYCAAGLPVAEAALTAASLQALAADRAAGPFPPQDLARTLPALVAELLG